MNTQRFVWAATALLFALVGGTLGWVLGLRYIELPFVQTARIENLIPPTLMIGGAIVAARFGSWIADRFLLPWVTHLHGLSMADRVLGVTGALVGLVFGVMISVLIPSDTILWLPFKIGISAVCAALGMAFFGGMRGEMLRVFPQLEADALESGNTNTRPKFLDTNIIIDGRLADLCATGFIDGPIYVPSFVLDEVQHIADSSDSLRRARGRRGLDVLNEMKEFTAPGRDDESVPLVQVLHEFPASVNKIRAVDSKLVALAREKNGAIITNDFNLNKVAELQGVEVLNLNQLTQALKPVVLPGEAMQITLVKEGKESHQGVGYLDDGTMVVVSDAVRFIGQTLTVVISTVYQTVAGKMIFAELPQDTAEDETNSSPAGPGDDLFDDAPSARGDKGNRSDSRSEARNGRDHDISHRSGGGMRRKSRTER